MAEFESIFIDSSALRPAPFVSTSYEYFKSGQYTIGGFLLVTLSGTIIDENINDKIAQILAYQSKDCVTVKIGCSGGTQFLDGVGRVRSVDINPSDQPFLCSYTMIIAIETINGNPSVSPDPSFLTNFCISQTDAEFLLDFSESVNVVGDGTVLSSNGTFGGVAISKSYVKATGQISVTNYNRAICGKPDYKGITHSLNILKSRAASLIGLNMCTNDHPLAEFNGWTKWLDSKSLDIDDGQGSVSWNFDIYMTKSSTGTPFAWVDATIDTRKDLVKKTANYTANGTIKGLSLSTGHFLNNKACNNERIGNARKAYNLIERILLTGAWEKDSVELSGTFDLTPLGCTVNGPQCAIPITKPVCYQRISSSTTLAVVNGEIQFTSEFGDIPACTDRTGIGVLDVTIDRTYPANTVVEHIVPSLGRPVMQIIGPTAESATVVVRGTLNGCDVSKMPELINCVDSSFAKNIAEFNGWLLIKEKKTEGTYSYSKTKEFLRCNT